ncbi:uncharacterized protein [Nicotiana tomentosiformis]|uniref:uncharacterized protein n=1 Tax=Nicotiana tomentosiformis TaxID=4098 RepID=UPI00388C9BF3
MAETPNCTVYVGNLDERVSDRVLYDILIQAGRIINLYIPRDKENYKPKGFAFAKYETEEIANYAVKLFSTSGLMELEGKMRKRVSDCQNAEDNGGGHLARAYLLLDMRDLGNLIDGAKKAKLGEGPSGTKYIRGDVF